MFQTAENTHSPGFDSSDILGRLKSSPVLIVDDAEFSRVFLEKILRSYGINNIQLAEDGVQALEKITSGNFTPDLIFLDLMMPNMDGFEFCRKLRAIKGMANIPVLVQSATDTPEDVARAFKVGATDFVNKPLNSDEVIARTQVHLENRALLDNLQRYKSRIKAELDDARKSQKSLLPSDNTLDVIRRHYNMDITTYFETSSELGGDFWGIKPLSYHELAIYMVDFSGHGVGAAINTFRLHAVLQEVSSYMPAPDIFLNNVNNRLYDLLDTGQFATMFYGILDIRANVMRYATAAFPEALLMDKYGRITVIDGTGVPLAVTSDVRYKIRECEFPVDSTLMLYSDALVETEDMQGNFIELDCWADLFDKMKGAGSGEMMAGMLSEFNKRTGHSGTISNLRDDLTINIFRRLR